MGKAPHFCFRSTCSPLRIVCARQLRYLLWSTIFDFVFFRYYLHLLKTYANKWDGLDTNSMEQCFDILLNFIVSDITGLPPIKVGQKLSYPTSSYSAAYDSSSGDNDDDCVNIMYRKFGYMPLQLSQVRMDPALFKDKVARWRKSYPMMENG